MKDLIRKRFRESTDTAKQTQERLADGIAQAAGMIIETYKAGRSVYVFGNGGSAADAQHIACELVGRFSRNRRALDARALAADAAVLTCLGNDFDFQSVFARQIEAHGRPGDVAIALSTSGGSPNVVAALATARQRGMKTIALTGRGGGRCAALADVLLDVPSECTPRVQESHAIIYHVICELVEAAFAEGL
jgi:D-sedoheptulose 7-phosphate isomerase